MSDQDMDLSDVDSEQFDEDNYEEKLAVWLDKQHAATGRFDQKPISAATPKPPLLAPLEYLIIIGTMVSAVRDNPNLAVEIEPDFPDADKPWGMGRNWCEYENACLINEVALIKRNGHDKTVCASFMGFLSIMLNRKYGIDRSENSCKNQWYRELRARSGIDERGNFRTPGKESARYSKNLRVSLTPKSRKRATKKQKTSAANTPTKKFSTQSMNDTSSTKSDTPAQTPIKTNTGSGIKISFKPKSSDSQ